MVNLALSLAEERRPRLALLRAIGLTRTGLVTISMLEAALYSLGAAVLGVLFSLVLGPMFPMIVVVPLYAYLGLPVGAILIGLLASVAGFRRAVAVDPARAFGGP